MFKKSLFPLLCSLLFSFNAVAQELPDSPTDLPDLPDSPVFSPEAVQNPEPSTTPSQIPTVSYVLPPDSELAAAFAEIPPKRAQAGQKLAQNSGNLNDIDDWIAHTDFDNPQNLILKDLLLAMPLSLAGPRLVELAKKSRTPAIQESWAKWLSQYPDAYESVLRAWLKLAAPNSNQFYELLTEYAKLKSDDAMDVWAQLISNFPARELGSTASFGLENLSCHAALVNRLVLKWNELKQQDANASPDNASILRLMTTFAQCRDPQNAPNSAPDCVQRREAYSHSADTSKFGESTDTISELVDKLLNGNISRRIVAIDFSRGWTSKQSKMLDIYESSKNSTEKAHALRILQDFCDEKQPERVMDALLNGDDTLRFETAAIIANYPQDNFASDKLQSAFDKEIWPETQLLLYQSISQKMTSDSDRNAFQKRLFLDAKRAQSLRLTAFNDLVATNPNLISLDDMSGLLETEAPIELISAVSVHLYKNSPDSRPKLRSWIQAQQPFDRPILAIFAQFMRIDAANKDSAAIETMRSVCAKALEQENILNPCIMYFESNAQTDEDRALFEQLQQRKNQFDAMTNIEF